MQLSKLSFALCLMVSLSACVVDDGDTDTDAGTGTDPATTDPATTDPATTDPVTTDPVTTDPATTDQTSTTDLSTSETSESESETDVSTSVADTSGTDTGTGGMCGWLERSSFYDCGGDGADPSNEFPLECPAFTPGDECDENSEISGIGCCTATSAAFCGRDGTIQEPPC